MKIVHINTASVGGGAAIAAMRHVEAMICAGHDTVLLASRNEKYKSSVYRIPRSKLSLAINLSLTETVRLLQKKVLDPIGTFSFNYTSYPIHKLDLLKQADIIILHWINGLVDTKEIEKILNLGKPTYWFMHDMYPITGGCHHALDCLKYMYQCKSCPLLRKKNLYDFAKYNFDRKLKTFIKFNNLSFIVPSRWLGNCVSKSKIGQGHKIYVIPNMINCNVFKPLEIETKSFFGLNHRKKTVLFSANNLTDPYKGTQYVIDCLKKLDPNKFEGLVIGLANKSILDSLPLNVVSTGKLSDELALSLAYNACDVVLISSIAENYPNVVLEAMACGKPCVGFPTGGIPDLIKHKISGYLTSDKNAEALFEGIEYVFSSDEIYHKLSASAHSQILKMNSYGNIHTLYKELGI